MLSNFLIIPVFREKIKLKLALAISADPPTTPADKNYTNSTTCWT